MTSGGCDGYVRYDGYVGCVRYKERTDDYLFLIKRMMANDSAFHAPDVPVVPGVPDVPDVPMSAFQCS